MYYINGNTVSESDFLACEEAELEGHEVYVRPVYRNGWWIGWCVYKRGEAVGKVFDMYKKAAQLRDQILSGVI
jgi:hypothetical protein